mgnify:CR=1 FL=1
MARLSRVSRRTHFNGECARPTLKRMRRRVVGTLAQEVDRDATGHDSAAFEPIRHRVDHRRKGPSAQVRFGRLRRSRFRRRSSHRRPRIVVWRDGGVRRRRFARAGQRVKQRRSKRTGAMFRTSRRLNRRLHDGKGGPNARQRVSATGEY